ncbi:MAG: hypothetical protein ACKO04_07790, partial [Actinomycetes bacterium]
MSAPDPVLVLRGGLPSWLVAGATPVLVLALLGQRLASDGLRQQEGEPVSPWFVALLTLGLAGFVVVRALSQRTEVHPDRIRCRNLLVTFEVDWADVERLQAVERMGLVVVEVHVRHLRRRHRLDAAIRFAGPDHMNMPLPLSCHLFLVYCASSSFASIPF